MTFVWKGQETGGYKFLNESGTTAFDVGVNASTASADAGKPGYGSVLFSGQPADNGTAIVGSTTFTWDTTSPNLATFSEAFGNAAWTKTASTIGTDTSDTTDIFGTNFAEKVTTTNATQSVTRAISRTALLNYAFTGFFKKSTASRYIWMKLDDGGGSVTVWFDLETGKVSNTSEVGGFTAVNTVAMSMTNGWYRFGFIAGCPNTTTGNWTFGISSTNSALTCVSGDIYYVFGGYVRQETTLSQYYSNIGNGSSGAVPAGTRIDATAVASATDAATAFARDINRYSASYSAIKAAATDTTIIFEKVATASALTFTDGLSNATFSAWNAGHVVALRRYFSETKAAVAQEVTDGVIFFIVPFQAALCEVQVRASTGAYKAWGGTTVLTYNSLTGATEIALTNNGTNDWAATDVITIIAVN